MTDEKLTGTSEVAYHCQHKAPWELPTPMQIATFSGGPMDGERAVLPVMESELVIMRPGEMYGSGRYVRGGEQPADRLSPLLASEDSYAWVWVPA